MSIYGRTKKIARNEHVVMIDLKDRNSLHIKIKIFKVINFSWAFHYISEGSFFMN